MRILVTGGGGFIGSRLAEALVRRGDTVLAVDLAFPETPDSETSVGVKTSYGDVIDAGRIISLAMEFRPDVVVHTAALVGVLPSRLTPIAVIRTNIEGSVNVFEAARLSGARRVIHLSSEEVYGEYPTPVVTEDSETFPVMPYGVTKLAVEHLGRSWRDIYGLEVINLRVSWVYGLGLRRPRVPRNLVEAAVDGRPLHMKESRDMTIDHTYIDDAIAGTIGAIDHPKHSFDVYNIASGEAPTVAELIEILNRLVPGADLSAGPGPMLHVGGFPMPRKGTLNCDRARESFGYSSRFNLAKGLQAYVAQYRDSRGRRVQD
jgi:UDP-glucose 4-epimerase